MIKKLAKYINGLWHLCIVSALGMIVEAVCELSLPSIANMIYEKCAAVSGDPNAARDVKSYVIKIGILMFIMAVVGLCGGLATMKASSVVSQKFSYRLRNDMYKKISDFSFKNIDEFSTSSLTTRMTNDVTLLQNTLMMGLRVLVRVPALLIVSAVFAFSINAKLSFILVVMLPIIIVIVALILKFGFPMFQKMQKKIDNVNRVVQENLIGIRVVKAFVREDKEKEKFHNASDELAKQGAKAAGLVVTVLPILMLMMNVVIVYIYYKGSLDAANPNVKMDVGQISVLASYIVQVLMNIMMVSMLMLQLTRAKACGDRVVVLDTEIDIKNPENAFVPENPQGNVEFKDVCFGYNKGDNVLENINFKANAGNIVGIIGSTGCGKSSLVNLIPRLYDVTGGSITLDGKDIRRIVMNKSYRNTIEIASYANQLAGITEVELFERHGKPVEEKEFPGLIEALERVVKELKLEKQAVTEAEADRMKMADMETAGAEGQEEFSYETAAVITRTADEAREAYYILQKKLEAEGFDTKERLSLLHRDSTNFKKGLTVTTFYMAKGLEFDQVFSVFPGADRSPIVQRARYIAATRALHELYMYEITE